MNDQRTAATDLDATYGEYKFVIAKRYLDYDPEISYCAIYGPEAPLPAHEYADVRVMYGRDRAQHEVAGILRELADHIADDREFDVAWARRAVTDPQFGTGRYRLGYEQNMREVLAWWERVQHDRSR